jgi:hypothetical protein
MKEVQIAIVNTQMANLGIEQEDTFVPLRFKESQFIGYWMSDKGESLTFYLGPQSFVCQNTQKNVELFESILK